MMSTTPLTPGKLFHDAPCNRAACTVCRRWSKSGVRKCVGSLRLAWVLRIQADGSALAGNTLDDCGHAEMAARKHAESALLRGEAYQQAVAFLRDAVDLLRGATGGDPIPEHCGRVSPTSEELAWLSAVLAGEPAIQAFGAPERLADTEPAVEALMDIDPRDIPF